MESINDQIILDINAIKTGLEIGQDMMIDYVWLTPTVWFTGPQQFSH